MVKAIQILAIGLGLGLLLGSSGCGPTIEPDGAPVFADRTPATPGRTADSEQVARTRGYAIELLMTMTNSPRAEVRANAIEALETESTRLEPIVAIGLDDPNEGVRSVAAMVAGKASLESLLPTLRSMRKDPSPYVRASAIFALTKMGSSDDPSELSKILFGAKNSRVRAHAAFILGEIGDRSAVPMLKQAYVTPVPNATVVEHKFFRLQIAEALFKLGDNDSIDSIRAALYPSRPEELEATALAVQVIGQIKDRGSIDQLIYLVNGDSDQQMPAEVRLAIATALASMGLTDGGYVADEYISNRQPTIRAQAASVYGHLRAMENLERLDALMRDSSALVRVSAAGAVLDLAGGSTRRSSVNDR
ncbi:MAG: HEAT repeat domain-containing protein [Phycisphaerales bacterium]|nr:HEAT repeat domain-containing protein [Phycisphaerales bacterium]